MVACSARCSASPSPATATRSDSPRGGGSCRVSGWSVCGGADRPDGRLRMGPPRALVPLMPTLVNLSSLIDDARCFELVRQHRWPDGVRCPRCEGASVARHGRDDAQPYRQRYRCVGCGARFDDLTGTALAGHHQPLRVWVLCLYLMGLNLSNRQIAQELDLGETEVQAMTEALRYGLAAKLPP